MEARKLALHLKKIVVTGMLAAALTYTSLAVPGHVSAVCSHVDVPVYCPVLAYGFPLPFLADSQGISPVGSVARDPLSLLVGLDDILWHRLIVSGAFWMLVASAIRRWWKRRQRKLPA